MKRLIRHYAVDTFSLYFVTTVASGIILEKGIETLLLAGLGLMAGSLLAKPVINILLLPLNLVTFGLFRWVASAIILYLVTLVVPGFKITGFHFLGFSSPWIDIPAISFSGVLAYIGFAFLLSLITSFIYWIVK
jgi:putative membrane protein